MFLYGIYTISRLPIISIMRAWRRRKIGSRNLLSWCLENEQKSWRQLRHSAQRESNGNKMFWTTKQVYIQNQPFYSRTMHRDVQIYVYRLQERFFKAIRRFSAFRRWHFVLWWYLFRVPFLLMLEIYQNHSEAQYKTVSFHSLCAASSRFLFTCAVFNKNSFLCCVFFAIATIQYMCVWAKCSCND